MQDLQELSLMGMEDLHFREDPGSTEGQVMEEDELGCVGAGARSAYGNTSKLKVLNYKQVLKTGNLEKRDEAIETEHNKFKKYKVWETVDKEEVPKGANILTSTWAIKKKPNRTYRARLNARGYKQVDGEHY